MRFFYWFSCFLGGLLPLAGHAQQLAGTITDAKTGQGIPFVNIGVVGKVLGTVSNEQGAYHLGYQPALAADTVRVSSLGYQPRRLLLRELLAQPSLALVPAAVPLGGVQVSARNPLRHLHTLGFTKADGNTTVSFNSHDLGAQVGTRIQLRRRPTLLRSITFNIATNQVGRLTFRVNILRLTAAGEPTSVQLLPRNLLVTTDITHGPVTIDLTADKLLLSEDFFLALEWVQGGDAQRLHDGLMLMGGIGYANNDLYYRQTSQANWERLSAGAVLAGMQPKIALYATVQD